MCDIPEEICGTNATYDSTQTTTKIVKDGKYYTQEEFRRAFPDELFEVDICGNVWNPRPNISADECKFHQTAMLSAVRQSEEDQSSRETLENIRTNCCVPRPTENQQNTGVQKNIMIGALVGYIFIVILLVVALARTLLARK